VGGKVCVCNAKSKGNVISERGVLWRIFEHMNVTLQTAYEQTGTCTE
jgi:hypothetical protein